MISADVERLILSILGISPCLCKPDGMCRHVNLVFENLRGHHKAPPSESALKKIKTRNLRRDAPRDDHEPVPRAVV